MVPKEPKLYPEDQQRVDRYLQSGYNRVERKPFRPFALLGILILLVTVFTGLSLMIAKVAGVY